MLEGDRLLTAMAYNIMKMHRSKSNLIGLQSDWPTGWLITLTGCFWVSFCHWVKRIFERNQSYENVFSSTSNLFLYECLAQDSFWNKGTRLTWKWPFSLAYFYLWAFIKWRSISSVVEKRIKVLCNHTSNLARRLSRVSTYVTKCSTVSELHSWPRVWPPRRTLNIILFPFCHRNLRQDGPWGSGAVFARKDACVPVWWWWSYRDAPGHDVRVETLGIRHPAGP